MAEPSPSRSTPDQFHKSMSGVTEFSRNLVVEPEFQLTHHALSAGECRQDGVEAHGIAVHCSSPVRYTANYSGRRHEEWAAPGMSWTRPAGTIQARRWYEPVEVVVLWLAPTLWSRVLQDCVPGAGAELAPRLIGVDPLIKQIALALRSGAELGQPFGRLLRDGLLVTLIAHLADQRHSRTPTAAPRGGLTGWRLRRVLEHLETHLAEDVPLAGLAELAGLSERHFCTVFRKTVGEPPHRYLVQRRIARAKSLFKRDRALSVIDVALAVGFTTSTHFATMFRKVTGDTPTAYRDSL